MNRSATVGLGTGRRTHEHRHAGMVFGEGTRLRKGLRPEMPDSCRDPRALVLVGSVDAANAALLPLRDTFGLACTAHSQPVMTSTQRGRMGDGPCDTRFCNTQVPRIGIATTLVRPCIDHAMTRPAQ
jgi:hypothetical protein